MPSNYTGSASGIAARQNATISEPVGTDVRNSASVRTPLEKIADFLQYLMQKAGILDAASTWTAKQTFGAGADVVGALSVTGAVTAPSLSAPAGSSLMLNAPADGQLGLQHAGTTVFMIDGNGVPYFVENRVTGVGTPTASSDAATKGYVDASSYALSVSADGTAIQRSRGDVTGVTLTRIGVGQYRVNDARITVNAVGVVSVASGAGYVLTGSTGQAFVYVQDMAGGATDNFSYVVIYR